LLVALQDAWEVIKAKKRPSPYFILKTDANTIKIDSILYFFAFEIRIILILYSRFSAHICYRYAYIDGKHLVGEVAVP
jgi:hypothetical protein